jgi:hypothetical protein
MFMTDSTKTCLAPQGNHHYDRRLRSGRLTSAQWVENGYPGYDRTRQLCVGTQTSFQTQFKFKSQVGQRIPLLKNTIVHF